MRKRIVIPVVGLLLLMGCVAEPEKPVDLIGKSEMVDVLIQVHLLEAKINKVPKRQGDSAHFLYNHYQNLLFEEMNIDSASYRSSMNYYLEYPEELTSIYQAVVDSLALRAKNRNID
ncbi:MAG: DUF4296 domain-containing protein [Cytophagales bacterium]|nr:DUF4296 domain-containing protein [Cytophagales bacterium]